MELDNFERAGEEGSFEDFQGPGMGFVYQAVEPQPAGTDVGNGEGEVKLPRIGVGAVVNRVCLTESGAVALFIGVAGTEGDFFKEGGGCACGAGYAA
jgi:hypothetical protein